MKSFHSILFTLSWCSLLLAALSIPVIAWLLYQAEGWDVLRDLALPLMFMGAMSGVALFSGIAVAGKRRMVLLWVIPLWLFYAGFIGVSSLEQHHIHYLRKEWLSVIGYSVLLVLTAISLLIMPQVLAFPPRVKMIIYRAVAIGGIGLLLISLPDLIF